MVHAADKDLVAHWLMDGGGERINDVGRGNNFCDLVHLPFPRRVDGFIKKAIEFL